GTRLATATATATEHMLGAIAQGTNVVLVTDENFVSFRTGSGVPWSGLVGDAGAFKRGRFYGLAAQSARALIAWRDSNLRRLAAIGSTGTLIAQSDDGSFIDLARADVTAAIPYGSGLLMFDGNPVRLTQIGFDLSATALGRNSEMTTFYRTA